MKRDRIGNYWFLFRLGFTIYISIPFAIILTIVNVFYLAIANTPLLYSFLNNFILFLLGALFVLAIICPLLGKVHLSRRTHLYAQEMERSIASNPFANEKCTPNQIPYYISIALWDKMNGYFDLAEHMFQIVRNSNPPEKYRKYLVVEEKEEQEKK